MRLGIHGSRSLSDERIKIIILEEIEKHKPNFIVTHAEPDGVCSVARAVSKDLGIPLCLHFLNFKFLRGAFEHRSKDVIKDSDFSVFIHDGESKGTNNEIALAKKMEVPHIVHTIKKPAFRNSVGFEIDVPWIENEILEIS